MKFPDVILIMDGKELKVHKGILAAASPVFSAMFTKNRNENQKSTVTVSDFSYEVINEMIRFIYTRKVKFLHNVVDELIYAAHRYGILDLKKLCEDSLCTQINLDTVLKLLVIADLNKAEKLKNLSLEFIIKNKDHFIDNQELKEITKNNSELCQSLFFTMLSFVK